MYTSIYDTEKNYIKWVSFDVSHKALDRAYRYDVETVDSEAIFELDRATGYLGARYGDFSRYKENI